MSRIGVEYFETTAGNFKDREDLVEDFFGMFNRYLRKAPAIVAEAPTLEFTLQLCPAIVTKVRQEALESIMAFVEEACSAVADYIGDEDVTSSRLTCGRVLEPYVLKIVPELLSATFELLAHVPW